MARKPMVLDERTRSLMAGFTPNTVQALEPQVVKYIGQLVRSGELAPDSTLPPTRALADLWKINPTSIHLALASLDQQGLLTRVHGRGTVVRAPRRGLTCLGLYESVDFLQAASGPAYERTVLLALRERLDAMNCTLRVWVDSRPKAEQHREALPALVDACQRQDIQGLIAVGADRYHVPKILRLPGPKALLGSAKLPVSVCNDARQLLEAGAAELARQGCRSIGLITPWTPVATNLDGSLLPISEALQTFGVTCERLGLATSPDWTRTFGRNGPLGKIPTIEAFGYNAFKTLWAHSPHPEGLIVADDVVARGVITAMLECRVDVPDTLKLALHRNRELPYLCPFPASFIEASAEEAAVALVETVRRQFAGEPFMETVLPHRVVAG